MTTININTLTIAQLESTPLEGFYIQPMPAKDLLRTVVDFANNRTENYVVELRGVGVMAWRYRRKVYSFPE